MAYIGKTEILFSAKVSVGEATIELQEKTATPSDKTQEITPDAGYVGLSKVTVNGVQIPKVMSETKTIKANGTYDAVDDGVAGYSHVTVDVPTSGGSDISAQIEKMQPITSDADGYVSPSTIYPDSGYDAMESVCLYFPEPIDASKIKKGEKILGVTGTYEASGGGGGGSALETCSLLIYGAGNAYQQMIPYIDSNGKLVFMTDCDTMQSSPYYDADGNYASFTIPKGAVIMKCGGELSSIAYGSEYIENITSNMNIDWTTDGQLQFYRITGDVEISW